MVPFCTFGISGASISNCSEGVAVFQPRIFAAIVVRSCRTKNGFGLHSTRHYKDTSRQIVSISLGKVGKTLFSHQFQRYVPCSLRPARDRNDDLPDGRAARLHEESRCLYVRLAAAYDSMPVRLISIPAQHLRAIRRQARRVHPSPERLVLRAATVRRPSPHPEHHATMHIDVRQHVIEHTKRQARRGEQHPRGITTRSGLPIAACHVAAVIEPLPEHDRVHKRHVLRVLKHVNLTTTGRPAVPAVQVQVTSRLLGKPTTGGDGTCCAEHRMRIIRHPVCKYAQTKQNRNRNESLVRKFSYAAMRVFDCGLGYGLAIWPKTTRRDEKRDED